MTLFKLEYNCFTMLYQFLLYNKVNQLYVCIQPFPIVSPSHPSPLSHPLSHQEHRAKLPVLCREFPLASCLSQVENVCQCQSLEFVPPSTSPPYPRVHSLCLHLYSCPANRFISTILLNFICIFFFFLTPSLCMTDLRSINITIK